MTAALLAMWPLMAVCCLVAFAAIGAAWWLERREDRE